MNGSKIVLDTNVMGLYLDGKFAKSYIKPNSVISISVVTLVEFLSNPALTVKSRFVFDDFIANTDVLPITKENSVLINQIISIRKKYKLKLPDAIIAATAIVNEATLFSADDVFSKVFNLKFQLIKV